MDFSCPGQARSCTFSRVVYKGLDGPRLRGCCAAVQRVVVSKVFFFFFLLGFSFQRRGVRRDRIVLDGGEIQTGSEADDGGTLDDAGA